jgi:beta-galactosidase
MAVDGDPMTFWHSPWCKKVALPHELVIELKEQVAMQGLTYLPRQNSGSGRIGQYEVFVSSDGKEWGNAVAKGAFSPVSTVQNILFGKSVEARFIRLRALSEQNGHSYAAIAELEIIPAR